MAIVMTSVSFSQERLAEDLFERHGRQVRQYLRGLTGSSDKAEDLAQEVFLRVVKHANGYQPRDRERPWLFRIARNAFIDDARQTARGAAVRVETSPAAGAATQDIRLELRRALAILPDAERDAFLLAEIGGLSYAEIADTLRVTVPAVRSSIYRARLALREVLGPPRPKPAFISRSSHDD